MATALSGVTVGSLLSARRKDLLFWTKQANVSAGRKALTLQGTVSILRQKLAAHLGLDLTASPPSEVVSGLLSMDLQLQQKQWAYLRELGKEWEEKAAAGLPFVLGALRGNFHSEHLPLLTHPLLLMHPNTVQPESNLPRSRRRSHASRPPPPPPRCPMRRGPWKIAKR